MGREQYGVTNGFTPDVAVIGQQVFNVTTPTFGIFISSGPQRLILNRMRLCQAGSLAGGLVNIHITIDTADRRSSGGVAIVPRNTNGGSSIAAKAVFLKNPTCLANGFGTRPISTEAKEAKLGDLTEYTGPLELWNTGSILVYTFAQVTAPAWLFSFEWIETELT